MTVRMTITTTDGVYEMTTNDEQPFIRVGKVDTGGAKIVDFRSEQAIEASNNITAYSLTKDVD